jgi:hypothetical protein
MDVCVGAWYMVWKTLGTCILEDDDGGILWLKAFNKRFMGALSQVHAHPHLISHTILCHVYEMTKNIWK